MASSAIKAIVQDGNTVRFLRYRQGVMYYVVALPAEVGGGERMFPVPLADIGDATLEAQDKALYFMRYIRKAMADGTWVPPPIVEGGAPC